MSFGGRLTADFFLVPFEDMKLFHRTDVKNAHSLVARSTGDDVPVGGPRHGLHGIFMLMSAIPGMQRQGLCSVSSRLPGLTASTTPCPCAGPRT
jgi:hypothetical protein